MSSSQTERAKAKLATLSASFDELEALVEPLFAQPLPDTLVGLEPIQQAKLQTLMPYLTYDLIFIYLKSRGMDPKSHPVVAELDRVKHYFNKINTAENPPQKRAEIDKDAAQRFIKHAIANLPKPSTSQEVEAAQSSTFVKPKVTSKMLERQQYEQELKEQDARPDEDSDLEMYGEEGPIKEPSSQLKDVKGKGKAVEEGMRQEGTSAPSKRRRPTVDPFASYGDDSPSTQPIVGSQAGLKPQPKKKKQKTTEGTALVTSSDPTPSSDTSRVNSPVLGDVKAGKKGKKAKKAKTSP